MRIESKPPIPPLELPPDQIEYGKKLWTNGKNCPSCQKWVSENARTCPHCGHTFTTASGVFVAIIVAIVLAALFGLLR